MLALVTCHIFPPSIWYGKKWIPGTWLPGWQLAVFQSPRLHECGPADAHGNAQPFCMDKCIFRKKTPVLQFGHTLEQNSSICPSISYLWMVDLVMRFFFLWGQPLKIIHENSAKKRSSPLDFIFDTCASASSSHLFLVGEAEHMWLYPFCKDKCIFRKKKRLFCNLGARWHKILEFGPSCPISGWLAWWCDIFPVGQPLKIIRKYSVKKGPAPWILFLTPAPRPLQVTFLVGEAEHVCLYPFARTTIFSAKKTCVLQFGRALTQNSWIRPIMSYQWMIGLVMRHFSCGPTFEDHPQVFSQKRSSPLDFIFDPCAFASWSHFFGWWRWTYVVVPLLQSYFKNHTHSINHGTFFPGVWHLDMF